MVQADPPYEESVTEIFPAHEVLRYVDMERDMIAVGSGDFPPGMFAIGDNGMGDYILLSLRSWGRYPAACGDQKRWYNWLWEIS